MLKANNQETLLIEGAVGKLELKITHATEGNKWVVICHPHPLFGGTMDNKVVTTLAKAFVGQGYGTLVFNFRGVGASEGDYDNAIGEQDDLTSVVAFLKTQHSVGQLTLAGFSFGGVIALKQAEKLVVDKLYLVAPAISLIEVSEIKINQPWVLIQGGNDEMIDAKEVLDWAMQQPTQPDLYWRAESSHFFHRQLIWLKKVVSLSVC